MSAATPFELTSDDRLLLELLPVLSALALLSNSVRVLQDLSNSAQLSPAFDESLTKACPTWADPLCHGGDRSAESIIAELSRYAAGLCRDVLEVSQKRGQQ